MEEHLKLSFEAHRSSRIRAQEERVSVLNFARTRSSESYQNTSHKTLPVTGSVGHDHSHRTTGCYSSNTRARGHCNCQFNLIEVSCFTSTPAPQTSDSVR